MNDKNYDLYLIYLGWIDTIKKVKLIEEIDFSDCTYSYYAVDEISRLVNGPYYTISEAINYFPIDGSKMRKRILVSMLDDTKVIVELADNRIKKKNKAIISRINYLKKKIAIYEKKHGLPITNFNEEN